MYRKPSISVLAILRASNQRNDGYVAKILNQCTEPIKTEIKLHCGVEQRLIRGKKMMMCLVHLKHKVKKLKWIQFFQN